jgi:hypothetical protein
MEKLNAKMKNLFASLITNVSKTYKECSNSNNESYLKGKKEAFEEILNWFVTSHNGELKYISATSFFNMIQEKLAKTKGALSAVKTDEVEEDIKPTMNFSEIKISDNRKRINRYAAIEKEHGNNLSYNPFNEEESNLGVNSLQGMSQNVNNFSFPFSINSLNEQGNSQIQQINNSLLRDTEMFSGTPVTFSSPFQNQNNISNISNNILNPSVNNLQVFNQQGSRKRKK